jgi:hypothetical protein
MSPSSPDLDALRKRVNRIEDYETAPLTKSEALGLLDEVEQWAVLYKEDMQFHISKEDALEKRITELEAEVEAMHCTCPHLFGCDVPQHRALKDK